MRVIIVSEALRAAQAEKFQRKFRDLFDGKFVFAGSYYDNGWGKKYPEYCVVRTPEKDEPFIDEKHEMEVEGGAVFTSIETGVSVKTKGKRETVVN